MTMLRALTVVSLLALAAADRYHPDRLYTPPQGRAAPAPAPAEYTAQFWYDEARAAIEKKINSADYRADGRRARNVVLFMGDGMSVPTLAAARTLLGQRLNRTGEEAQLSFETFPTLGLTKTYCVNAQIADSACTASAYLCGVKVNQGTLGVSAAVPRYDCAASRDNATNLQSIAAWALADGRDAGIVTTTRITHASPGGAFAVSANRNWENDAEIRADGQDPNICPDIAQQLIKSYPGNQFKVILGGGRREFRPTTTVDEEGARGRRTDGRDLIQEWQADKAALNTSHQYVWNRDQLLQANASLDSWRSHVDVPLESETHGADDVAVFARGPHHALFTGLFEQSGVPHRMAFAACLGPGPRACSAAPAPPQAAAALLLILAILLSLR